MPNASILTVLRERAGLAPNDTAFTFIDYEQDWEGTAESLTWAQLYRRTLNLAHEIKQHGSPGDRAVIVAPQSLAYIVAFLGAMQAGLIAVPLSAPTPGSHDERITAVVADTSPAVLLTTAAAADSAAEYVGDDTTVIVLDTLNLDERRPVSTRIPAGPDVAYLQYTSGSTRLPAGVMISHRNLQVNFEQMMADVFADRHGVPPADMLIVSWLPLYHDMGLMVGVAAPILGGFQAELISPIAFLQRPARWLRAMARDRRPTWSAAPNFAFDLTARRTTDEDTAGLDLSNLLGVTCGAERIHPSSLIRFTERFTPFGCRTTAVQPSYGLAEATVYVSCGNAGREPEVVTFDPDQLSGGTAVRTADGAPLMRYGVPTSPLLHIVDADTGRVCPDGTVGEIWVHGDNVSGGYWRKPEQTGSAFGATVIDPPPGAPPSGWLRTGDQGFISEGDLFIVGRVKDMLIVRGRNHYPEDIEATVQEITGGRVAAIAVPVNQTEKLVTIIEFKNRAGGSEAGTALSVVKNDVTTAISQAHGLTVADIVLVAPGSIPTTTSGKIRRSACVERHRRGQFTRLDA